MITDFKSQASWLDQARKMNEKGEQAVSDNQIIDALIQQRPELSQPYSRLKKSTKDHPLAATKFLNHTFYGDANYAKPVQPPKSLSLEGLVDTSYLNQSDPSRYSTQDLQSAIGKPEGAIGAVVSGIKGGVVGGAQTTYNVGKSVYDMVNHPIDTIKGAAAVTAGGIEESLTRLLRGIGLPDVDTPERQQFMQFMRSTGAADLIHGAMTANPDQALTGADTALNFAYQHPLETAMVAEGGVRGVNKVTGKNLTTPLEAGQAITNTVKGAASKAAGKIPGVQSVKDFSANRKAQIDTTKAANQEYLQEASRPKTYDDISAPARTKTADIEASKSGTAIIEKGKVIGYKPDAEVSSTLKRVVTDPNNVPQSLGEIQKAKGSLSESARAELTKQNAGKINEFQTQRYQKPAIKEVRKTLTESMQTDEARLHFDEAELPKVQNTASILENKYAEFLRQTGEKEVAKLDLRQWIDKQIPNSSYSKSLAELPVATRSLVVFRRALSNAIKQHAKAVGGNYAKFMDEITNLYKAEETVSSHIPKPETLMERYTLDPKVKLPNEVPPTVGEMVKTGAKKLVKPALKGAGFGIGAGLLP